MKNAISTMFGILMAVAVLAALWVGGSAVYNYWSKPITPYFIGE